MRRTALNMVYELAKRDPRVIFIGSDLGPDTLQQLKAERPNQFLMEGVSEANIVTLAAGLALEGKIPYINTIATFLTRRCFEQIVLDLGLHKTKVRLIGSGGGLVYAPLGPTHLATDDIAILRTVPNMTILAPADAEEMRRLMSQTLEVDGPVYIRLGKGGDPVVSRADLPCQIGGAISMREGRDALIIATGICLQVALEAAAELEKQGLAVGVLHVHTLKPLDAATIFEKAAQAPVILTIEEHILTGGLGAAVAEIIAEAGFNPARRFRRVGIPDVFPDQYGSQASLMARYDITSEHLTAMIKQLRESPPANKH
ncbi:MAG: transketolase C-terminal domain-containing protein [Verrucomicrobiota bacterium]|jgi:transketolase